MSENIIVREADLVEINVETGGEEVDYYTYEVLPPHDLVGSIPPGRVFPSGATAQFDDGTASYQASPELAASTGLIGITASCGNPVDGHDQANLYATMRVRQADGIVWVMAAGMTTAAACADGVVNVDDKPVL